MTPARIIAAVLLAAASVPAQSAPGIGEKVAEFSFTDIRYLPRKLGEFGPRKGFVLYFVTAKCPLVLRYLPRVGEIAAKYAPLGVQFVAVNVAPGDSVRDTAAQSVEYGIGFPFVKDLDGSVARAVGVDRTACAVVLDGERHLLYRGRIDSQYRYSGVRPTTGRRDLVEALDDLVAGRPVRVAETEWEGCKITQRAPVKPSGLTFTRDIAPIVQRHCQDCHRSGGEAPLEFMTYEDVADNAEMIGEVVAQQRMPPWYGASEYDGAFINHRGLTDKERRKIASWVADIELPRGDPNDMPTPREFPTSKWRIGEPDLVLKVPAPARLPAHGYVDYKYLVLPYRFKQDTWVEAIEIRPDNKRVLHHANLVQYKWGERFSQRGFITGQVPGGDAMVLDPGVAVKIHADSVLALQVHYVTTGKPEVDRLRVGLRFPRVRVRKQLHPMIVTTSRFEIPAGAEAHVIESSRRFRDDAVALGLFSHMHLRGRDMVFRAEYPDGEIETLLAIPNYNFDWQQSYRWSSGSRKFPKGTRIRVTARYDNSAFNPFNPDASQSVRFGQQTYHEMMHGFLFYLHENERLDLAIDPKTGFVVGD